MLLENDNISISSADDLDASTRQRVDVASLSKAMQHQSLDLNTWRSPRVGFEPLNSPIDTSLRFSLMHCI